MIADYISECPECGEGQLRCDNWIGWSSTCTPDEYGYYNYERDKATRLAGRSDLRYLVAEFQCYCKACPFRYDYSEVIAELPRLPEVDLSELADRCNHCHTVWGQGAEKYELVGGLACCSRCRYTQ